MFTKLMFPPVNTYLLENSRSPKLSTIHYRCIAQDNDRPWLALGLVLCAHLAVFAALRPQAESLPVPPQPEPIMISLLSAPQPVAQPAPPKPAQPVAKPQQPVVKKAVKTPPVNRAVVKQAAQPAPTPAPQAAEPVASQAASAPVVAQQPSKPTTQQAYHEPDFNAAYLNNPAPDYPSVSRRLGEEGLVMLQVRVNENGKADSVELKTSSGSDRLDEAALEAVKKWRFVPAKRGDQPVSASVVVPVKFSLEG